MSAVDPVPLPPTRPMIVTLGLTALICGVLVVTAYELALPRIQENHRITLERGVFTVLRGATTRRMFVLTPEGLVASDRALPAGLAVHAGYGADGRLIGIAAEGGARGYTDVVRLLYAWSPECQCINAITVLSNRDTPGIGDKVSRDRAFLENFRALSAAPNAEGSGLAHPIVTVKHGTKLEAWQIDAISGATITSRAVGKALNDSARQVVPAVVRDLDKLRSPPTPRP
jgi:electron transport complex protein RnfG